MSEATVKNVKTKAKARYLKAKRARRKKRKTGVRQPAQKAARGEDESDLEGSDLEEDLDTHQTSLRPKSPAAVYQDQDGQDNSPQKPRKRRRVETHKPGDQAADMEAVDAFVRLPTPELPFLPSFPAPRQLDGPSQAELALQGLDQALIDAELVDPSTVLPLDSKTQFLNPRSLKRLTEQGITEFFAVQTALLPFLLPLNRSDCQLYRPYDPPRDVCVSAPTGSGKTLAYVLPIIEILSTRIVTRLRALVVLPTRDLVTQVRETFEAFCKGRGLKIGTATGQHSFAHEQAQLVEQTSLKVFGGSSKVDILLCTPGRLIDHLSGTPNFTLQHLRFLVIDEADRLLAQSFQDWLARVLAAIKPRTEEFGPTDPGLEDGRFILPSPDALAPAWRHARGGPAAFFSDLDVKKHLSCQKLLFSATLTRDPSQIAALDLYDPKYFIVQGSSQLSAMGIAAVAAENFAMPSGLAEYMIVCESARKPLMLFHLVHSHSVTNALVFTKSAESTTRLVRLFDFFEFSLSSTPRNENDGHRRLVTVSAYSSDLPESTRKSVLERFKTQDIDILVCSDVISRGIDISHVSHVVNYDVPVDMRKYVHRAGRTARAGRSGDAWSLVEEQEAHYFKNMLSAANHLKQVKRLRVTSKDVDALEPHYQAALGMLKEAYSKSSS